MRWMLLLAVIGGCAWTNQATVDAQKRAAEEAAHPELREAREQREARESEAQRSGLAAGLAGLGASRGQPSGCYDDRDCNKDQACVVDRNAGRGGRCFDRPQ